MNESYATTVNNNIADLKKVCVDNLVQWYSGLSGNKEALTKGSWTDIIGVVYRMIATIKIKSTDGRHYLEHNVFEDAYNANFAVVAELGVVYDINGLLSIGKKEDVKQTNETLDFYTKAFSPASEYAKSLLNIREYPMRNEYIILPNGGKYNNGLPVSVRRITPRAMEVSAVSKDLNALNLSDSLCYVNGGLAVIKLVKDLPNSALVWATQNNVKVY
jgi:hypothetical protein